MTGWSRERIASASGLKNGFAGSIPASTAIYWRRVVFIGLVWLFVCNSDCGHMLYRYYVPEAHVCNPLKVETCEP
jgi:hypothetical protein